MIEFTTLLDKLAKLQINADISLWRHFSLANKCSPCSMHKCLDEHLGNGSGIGAPCGGMAYIRAPCGGGVYIRAPCGCVGSFLIKLSPSCCTGSVALPNAAYGSGIGPVLVMALNCNGTESNVSQCAYVDNFFSCGHYADAGVVCKGEPLPYHTSHLLHIATPPSHLLHLATPTHPIWQIMQSLTCSVQ